MLYSYIAKNQKGETYSGEYEAKSKIDLYSLVRNEGGKILSVREKHYTKITKSFGSMFGMISFHDKIVFVRCS